MIIEKRLTRYDIELEWGHRLALAIIQAFKNEGLDFEWSGGFWNSDSLSAVNGNFITACLTIVNDELFSDIVDSDIPIFKNMIDNVITKFIADNPLDVEIKYPYFIDIEKRIDASEDRFGSSDILWIRVDLKEGKRIKVD